MGVAPLDRYTSAHFLWGVTSRFAIPRALTGPIWDFVVAMGLHVISELNENDSDPEGTILESTANHVMDQIAYTAGWAASNALAQPMIIADGDPSSAAGVILFACATQFFWTILCKELAKEINMRIEWG